MKQTSTLTRSLAAAQEHHVAQTAVTYRLYTEDVPGLVDLTKRYFKGASFFYGQGLSDGQIEAARIIEIVGTLADLQRIVDLAGDIRVTNHQSTVLVTWTRSTSFVVAEPELKALLKAK